MYGIISMMNEMLDLAKAFKALGEPSRLRIVEFLQGCCQSAELTEQGEVLSSSGPTAGQVCCTLTGSETINSTVSHHLHQLEQAGLIRICRKGKSMICTPNAESFRALIAFLQPYAQGGQDNGCC